MKHNLIIPLAADRTDYNKYLPEWLDMHPKGNLMLYECIRGLPLQEFDLICPVILAKHDRQFNAAQTIENQFRRAGLRSRLHVIQLAEPTKSQPETVVHAIDSADISGSIYIKDGDNYFKCFPILGENSVAIYPLDSLKNVNPTNKSYIMMDDNQYISNIIEKVIISRYFCAGGYGFESSELFLSYFNKLAHYERLYTSHIIYSMILDKYMFRPSNVKDYIDWGTREEWLDFKNQYVTLFVPYSSLYNFCLCHNPDSDSIIKSDLVKKLNERYNAGKTKIIILSQYPEDYRPVIEQKLNSAGIHYHQILFGIFPNGIISSDMNKL